MPVGLRDRWIKKKIPWHSVRNLPNQAANVVFNTLLHFWFISLSLTLTPDCYMSVYLCAVVYMSSVQRLTESLLPAFTLIMSKNVFTVKECLSTRDYSRRRLNHCTFICVRHWNTFRSYEALKYSQSQDKKRFCAHMLYQMQFWYSYINTMSTPGE